MAEATLPSASVEIFEQRTSAVTRRHYKLVLRGAGGAPVAGEELTVTLEGDGSLAPGFSSKQVKRETDAEGAAIVAWYRRSIFDRNVRGTLSVAGRTPGASLTMEPVEIRDTGPRTSYAGTKLR